MKDFPILLDGKNPCRINTVPMFYVAQFERQIQANHGQTVKGLAERGGLSPKELYAVAHGLSFFHVKLTEKQCAEWLEAEAGIVSEIKSLKNRIEDLEAKLNQANLRYDQKILKLVNNIKNMKATINVKNTDLMLMPNIAKLNGNTYNVTCIIYSEDGERYFLENCPQPQWFHKYVKIKYE